MYPIPANATRIRWIANGGTLRAPAYISTGVSSGDNVGFEVEATRVDETTSDAVIFGARQSSGDTRYFVGAWNDGGGKYYWGWNGRIDGKTLSLNTKHTLGLNFLNSRTATFDGSFVGTLSGTYLYELPLLYPIYNNMSDGSKVGPLCWHHHRCRISIGSNIVRDFIPCRVGHTGYLFDRVSGQLFGNAGTGDFVLGPDTFQQGVLPTRMMAMGVRKKNVWPTPLYTGVSLVGSSVQNNAGILSGFTASSYATMPWRMTAGATSLEAVVSFSISDVTTNAGIWGCVGDKDSFTPFYHETISVSPRRFGSYLSANGTSWTIAPHALYSITTPPSGHYTLKLLWSEGVAKLWHWDGSSWQADSTAQISAIYGESGLVPQLGTNRGKSYPLDGTIDLNYAYLMRDGELWWEGAAGAYKNVKTIYPD